jgi:hypothetical protein
MRRRQFSLLSFLFASELPPGQRPAQAGAGTLTSPHDRYILNKAQFEVTSSRALDLRESNGVAPADAFGPHHRRSTSAESPVVDDPAQKKGRAIFACHYATFMALDA